MRGIFANRWWIVFATGCGLIVGGGAINVFAFAVFLKPITALWRRMLERELRAMDEGGPVKQWIPAPAQVVPTLGF
jgi:hypothetical protein